MAADIPRQYNPLTCHGHSRPVTHVGFSHLEKEETYYMISACKGRSLDATVSPSDFLLTPPDGNPMLRDGMTGDWYARPLFPYLWATDKTLMFT